MIASEFGSSGACEMSWFQARWSGSEGASAATSGPGRGKTPHWSPSEPRLDFGESAANAMATEASAAAATAIVVRTSIVAAYAPCRRPSRTAPRGRRIASDDAWPDRSASWWSTAALLPLLGEPGAEAAFPGADGRIAFTQEAPAGDHTQSDIYTVNADGSGLLRLSRVGEPERVRPRLQRRPAR